MFLLSLVQGSCKRKSRSFSDRNKTCRKCFFCLSLSFCSSLFKCLRCCRKSTCGGQVAKVLGNMAQPGFKSSDGLHLAEGLQPTVQDDTCIDKVTSDSQQIRKFSQEQLFEGGTGIQGPVFMKSLSQGLGLKSRLLSRGSAQKLLLS